MLTCFLCAMDSEAKPLLAKAELLATSKVGFASLYSCAYEGKRFFLAVCGIGKVLSACGLAGIAVAHPEIDQFVNLGVGGSLDPKTAPLLSAVVGKGYVQHDMDTSPIGDPKAFLSGVNLIEIPAEKPIVASLSKACEDVGLGVYQGTIVSGDTFVVDEEIKRGFVRDFHAISVDMEAASYAEAAYVYGKPFAALRIISDVVDHNKEYMLYKDKASEIGSEVALAFLKRN